jgi:hypothetical protein
VPTVRAEALLMPVWCQLCGRPGRLGPGAAAPLRPDEACFYHYVPASPLARWLRESGPAVDGAGRPYGYVPADGPSLLVEAELPTESGAVGTGLVCRPCLALERIVAVLR